MKIPELTIISILLECYQANLFSINAKDLANISIMPANRESTKPYYNSQLRRYFALFDQPKPKMDTKKKTAIPPPPPPPPPGTSAAIHKKFQTALNQVRSQMEVSDEVEESLQTLLSKNIFNENAESINYLEKLITDTVRMSSGGLDESVNPMTNFLVLKDGRVRVPFRIEDLRDTALGDRLPRISTLSPGPDDSGMTLIDLDRDGGVHLGLAPKIASPSLLRSISFSTPIYEEGTDATTPVQSFLSFGGRSSPAILFKMLCKRPLTFPLSDLDLIDSDDEAWWLDDDTSGSAQIGSEPPLIIKAEAEIEAE